MQKKNKKIDHELIFRDELEDVHIFDYFIDEFRDIIADIHNKHPDDTIYLNVSSGTPAMKSALQILAAFREFDFIPIQVATPEKKSNPHVEEKENYNAVEQWECNDDNASVNNRCASSENINFLSEIKKQMLCELINKYDYVGAKTLADTMGNVLNERFKDMLNGAVLRSRLKYAEAAEIFKKYGHMILPVAQSDAAPMTEYFLLVYLRTIKEEYADFLRSLTPLFADLLERVLRDKCGFNVADYTNKQKNTNSARWSLKKLAARPDVKNALDNAYKDKGGMREDHVSSHHLLAIIEYAASDAALKKLCTELRQVEENARNLPAHEIVSIDDNWIKTKTGCTAKNIVSKINMAFNYTNIKLPKDVLDSYDKMNTILTDGLKIKDGK